LQAKLQFEPLRQLTCSSLQSLPLQSKLQVLPAPQLALPLQVLAALLQRKLHVAPSSQATSRQLPLRQSKLQLEPVLHTVPSQLPEAQFSAHDAWLSQTTPVQRPRELQPKVHVAPWLHCTSLQLLPLPLQPNWHIVPILHSAPLHAAAVQAAPSKQRLVSWLQPPQTVVSKRHAAVQGSAAVGS